ncbi:MAG: hypothetical protein KDC98_15875 [Planctomycetes bacterium]|nr:hypothetical protein [Planctomycetota bacterium]
MQLLSAACPHPWIAKVLVLLATFGASGSASAQDEDLHALGGEWRYVADLTEGKPIEKHGPPMSISFGFRFAEGAVIMIRARREERIPIDGSVHEVPSTSAAGSVSRCSGTWQDGVLVYDMESVRTPSNERTLLIRRKFRPTPEGLEVRVATDGGTEMVALYRHLEDIEPATPIKGAMSDLAWLAGAWVGTRNGRSIEERWSPPLGGAMLGVSRTVRRDKMTGFEYLRIVERDGSLVYIAQPGGNPPTEFVLTELEKGRAVFKNPLHSFPQRIVYEITKGGGLTARIGFANGGDYEPFEFEREAR